MRLILLASLMTLSAAQTAPPTRDLATQINERISLLQVIDRAINERC